MDCLLEVDWAAHWRALVQESRRAGPSTARSPEPRPRGHGFEVPGNPDILPQVIEPYLSSGRTVIDVGAGAGRHVRTLAPRVRALVAVEPAAAQAAEIPRFPNVTVMVERWEDADVPPADLVICSHVLYAIDDVVPFLEKMERCARQRVFVYLRDGDHRHPANELLEATTGRKRPRQPRLSDLFNLLRQRDKVPYVVMSRDPWRHRYASRDDAIADLQARLGDVWDEALGRAWIQGNLQAQPDGSLTFDRDPIPEGVIHWDPLA